MSTTYELVFHGPVDEKPETMRKLRGVLVAEMQFTIEEARQLLEKAPIILFSTPDRNDAESLREQLAKAGAKMKLVTRKPVAEDEEADQQELVEDEETDEEEAEEPREDEEPDQENEEGFSFEMDVDLSNGAKKSKAPPEPKVYELNTTIDGNTEIMDSEVANLLRQLKQSELVTPIKKDSSAPVLPTRRWQDPTKPKEKVAAPAPQTPTTPFPEASQPAPEVLAAPATSPPEKAPPEKSAAVAAEPMTPTPPAPQTAVVAPVQPSTPTAIAPEKPTPAFPLSARQPTTPPQKLPTSSELSESGQLEVSHPAKSMRIKSDETGFLNPTQVTFLSERARKLLATNFGTLESSGQEYQIAEEPQPEEEPIVDPAFVPSGAIMAPQPIVEQSEFQLPEESREPQRVNVINKLNRDRVKVNGAGIVEVDAEAPALDAELEEVQARDARRRRLSDAMHGEKPYVAAAKKKNRIMSLGEWIGLGVVLVGLMLVVSFTQRTPEVHEEASYDPILDLVQSLSEAERRKVELGEILVGNDRYPLLTLGSTWELDEKTLAKLRLYGSSPQPPERSPEQIVHNIKGAPWLYKIEADEWTFHFEPSGQFSGTSAARLFIEYGSLRSRHAGFAHVNGIMDPAKGIEAAVEIRSDQNFIKPETAPANPILDISPLDNGGFKVSIVAKVQAKNLHQ